MIKKNFNKYLSARKWLITEEGWTPVTQARYETLFSIGNGFIGSRGVLEEIPYNAHAGTYINGIFDSTGAQTAELVNTSDPINFKITTEGEKVDVIGMDVISHSRVLDMKTATLFRITIFKDSKKRRYEYTSARFLSSDDVHKLAMFVSFKPLDADTEITIESAIDTSIENRGVLTEGRKKHAETIELAKTDGVRYRCVQTFEKKIQIAYALGLKARIGKKKFNITDRIFNVRLKKGQKAEFEKFVSIYTSLTTGSSYLKDVVVKSVKKSLNAGFDKLYYSNKKCWLKKWRIANINIKGDTESDKALRFNIYHLLIAAHKEYTKTSIGARALTSEGYRGHVFWDTEIFMFPFYLYTNPDIAKTLLMYRYNRLNPARTIAKEKNFKGAMFPWESADTGKETTPTWFKDLSGSIIRIRTNEMEHHIVADVAYAVSHYYNMTADDMFMIYYGIEIMIETARFWVSRATYNKKTKTYDIKNVIGPDEFHEKVNNNAYTNIMAKWNVLRAIKLYRQFARKYPVEMLNLAVNIRFNKQEMRQWAGVASSISTPNVTKDKVVEQFSGYFKKRYIKIKMFDENYMPQCEQKLTQEFVNTTQFVKQADVLMLMYLLSDHFTLKEKQANFDYYNKRTLHKSSLSPAVHAIMATEAQHPDLAFQYFHIAVNADLRDIHRNIAEGIHAASMGGAWQAVVNGFAGTKLKKKILSINPRLPGHWKEIEFSLFYKNRLISVKQTTDRIIIYIKSNRKDFTQIRIFGCLQKIQSNKKMIFRR